LSVSVIEVDQSGRIEDPQHTVLAYSNHIKFAIAVPAISKRTAIAYLRQRGRSQKDAVILVFSAALVLLLTEVVEGVSRITIDHEYPGHEDRIKGQVLWWLRGTGHSVSTDVIQFDYIGKSSGAHERAIAAFRGGWPADRRIRPEELITMLSRGK
jgi:hypothetical protein